MKLEKLRIHKYRGIAPGAELTFGPSLNLVLGDNGTGRTTLLELISRLLCADFSELGHEAFSLEYELRFPGMKIHAHVRNEEHTGSQEVVIDPQESALLPPRTPESGPKLEPSIEVTLQLDAPGPRLVVRADEKSLSCEVDGQPGYSQNMHRWSVLDRTLWVLIFMAAQYLEPEVKERLKELLRRTFLLSPSRFDESLGMFEKIGAIRYGMEMHGDEVF
ncbi:MAG TPA: AAA family ATPase, partial [Myxococcaceae bacterium]|nr:AAA family ATPase [Myxococcaceae bacterium]